MLVAPPTFPGFPLPPSAFPMYEPYADGAGSPSHTPTPYSPSSSPISQTHHHPHPHPHHYPLYTPYSSPASPPYGLASLQYVPYPHPYPALQPAPKPQRNLHVDNLPPVSDASLRALFRPYGRIVRVRVVAEKETGVHAGYGFVEYEREDEARRAMEEMEGQLVWSDARWEAKLDDVRGDDNSAAATIAAPRAHDAAAGDAKDDSAPANEEAAAHSPDATEDEAQADAASLAPFVPPASASRNPDGSYTLKSGILLSPAGQIGKRLRVTFARQKRRPPSVPLPAHPPLSLINTNLYIAGLPPSFTKPQLDALFSPFSPMAPILESRILLDRRTGNSRGVGFVRFETQTSCQAAIRAWNGRVPPGAAGPITVRYATDRNSAAAVAAAQRGEAVGRPTVDAVAHTAQWVHADGGLRMSEQWESDSGLAMAGSGGSLMQRHSPPSPLDMQQAMMQQVQLNHYYPFLPPLSPLSPPDSPHSFSAFSSMHHPLHYSPPSPPARLLPLYAQMPSATGTALAFAQFHPRVVEVTQAGEAEGNGLASTVDGEEASQEESSGQE